jgi:hypothetical protein
MAGIVQNGRAKPLWIARWHIGDQQAAVRPPSRSGQGVLHHRAEVERFSCVIQSRSIVLQPISRRTLPNRI